MRAADTAAQISLANCDEEPIRIPGKIQPHGALVAFDARDLRITHVSDNVGRFGDFEPGLLLGSSIEALLDSGTFAEQVQALGSLAEGRPVYLLTLPLRGSERAFDAIAHRNGGLNLLELEPAQAPAG